MHEHNTNQPSAFSRGYRTTRILMFALAGILGFASPARAQHVQVTAPHVLLLDFKTGSILFSRSADEPLQPANMAKLMTLAVVFEELKRGKIRLDTEFPVSNHAWRTGGAPSGTSTMFAAVRTNIRVEDLIIGTAVVSGNDAAIVLAEGISGSEKAFTARMNELAAKLGLTTARFTNPTGAGSDQRISARDLAKLSAHLIREYPDYYKYFKVAEITWSKIKQANRNPLLSSQLGVDGLVTGSTRESGYGFAASAEQNGQRLIVVVHGAKSEKDRTEDARRLLDWGFRSFSDRLLFTGSNQLAHASVYGGAQSSVPVVARNDVHILSLQGTNERFIARVVYEGPLRAPIAKGAEIAKLRVYRGDQIAYETPLYAAEDVAAGSIFGRAFDSAYEFVAGLVRAGARKIFSRNS
jgi:D-alanyl-D-alanine carboxypeptidase (penicillin-binding protein 5/6)